MARDLLEADYHLFVAILLAVIGIVVPTLYVAFVLIVTRRHPRLTRSTFEHLDAMIKGEKRRRDDLVHGK